jgi:acetylornithine deacetylase/succinyl-diaminopimelate desuccinylase family protein
MRKETVRSKTDEYFSNRGQEAVKLLSDLVAANTTNPPGNEAAAADAFERYLAEDGIPCERFERDPGRTNIAARVGEGRPRLLIACHLDVVPAGDDWGSDPFTARVEGGRVYGRGASDDKGPTAAALMAARFLKRHAPHLRGQFIVLGAADEERGSGVGLEWLLQEGKLTADMAIVPDVSNNMRMIDVAEKGALFLEAVSHGRQAHGSTPERGINAVTAMTDLLNALREMTLTAPPHRFLGPPTVNIGAIHGGTAPNIVPAKCTAAIDIRYVPGLTGDEIAKRVRALAAAAAAKTPGARIEVFIRQDLLPTEVEPDLPLVRLIREQTKALLGFEAQPIGMPCATLAKQLIGHGIPAVGFSCGDDGQAHTTNESIAISEVLGFARLLSAIALSM